jgi:hypothetical protein
MAVLQAACWAWPPSSLCPTPAAGTSPFLFSLWNYLILLGMFEVLPIKIYYFTYQPHCNENPIVYIPFSGNYAASIPTPHSCVCGDLYIPRIGPHISCTITGRSIVGIYKSLIDTWMGKLGLWPRNSFSGNIYFEFSVLVLCSVMICLSTIVKLF